MLSPCPTCQTFQQAFKIDSAQAFQGALAALQQALAAGTIIEAAVWPEGQLKMHRPPFDSIARNGPWPDYVQYFFACGGCKTIYQLSVETFHGIGGEWSIYNRAQ